MYILCPICEDPSKNLWVNVSSEKEYGYGRFAGSSTVYVVEDIEQTCDCEYDKWDTQKVEEEAVKAYCED